MFVLGADYDNETVMGFGTCGEEVEAGGCELSGVAAGLTGISGFVGAGSE